VPAVLFFPVLVEVDEDVDAALEIELGVMVKVRVHAQLAAGLDLMESSADVVWIGNDALDAGKNLEELDHRTAVEEEENIARAGRPALYTGKGQLLFVGIVELLPLQFFGLRKFTQCSFGSFGG